MRNPPSKSSLMTLLLVTAFISSAWLASNYLSISQKKSSSADNSSDAFMTGVKYTLYDKQGQWQTRFTTPYLKHYTQGDRALIDKPYLTTKGQDKLTWIITADNGISENSGKTILLHDNVHVQRITSSNQKTADLTTTAMTAHPKEKLVMTDQPVTIIQPGSIVHATGLNADLNTGDITLLAATQGVYEKPTSE